MRIKRVKYKEVEKFPSFNFKQEFKGDFFGSSPAPFIGRFGYPAVNIGVLSPQFSENSGIFDNPQQWSAQSYSLTKIAGMRYQMVNSRQHAKIMVNENYRNKLLEICQEVGMASKPVELEVNLDQKPKLRLEKETEIIPFGPAGKLKKIKITENSKIDHKVDRVVSDTDLKAVSGVLDLYQRGFDQNFLTKLISVGNLGLKKNRKLVPTRWSITAIDETIGKDLIKEVKRFSNGEYSVYFGGDWGNYYLVLFFPEVWSYELFEMYMNYQVNPWSKAGYFYSTDYENYQGRISYAQECAGGYYASRISVLEKMKEIKRQHSALVLRFITPEYNVPLGVWVCREATKKSLMERPVNFASQELMIKYATELIKRKFDFDLDVLLKESKLLKEKKIQRKLFEF